MRVIKTTYLSGPWKVRRCGSNVYKNVILGMHAGTKWPLCPLKLSSLPDLTGVPPTKVFSSPICLSVHPSNHTYPSIYLTILHLPAHLPP